MKYSHALIFDGPVTYGQTDAQVRTSSNLDDVKDAWEFKYLPDKEIEWPALKQDAIHALQRIELHINKLGIDRRILDVGSGWGFFLAVAKAFGWTTYGLEPLLGSAVYARATFGLNITADTLREDTFPPDSFDVITSFQVFEHLPNPQENLQYFHRMLREDGLILIEVPNFETWTVKLMKSQHRHFVQDHLNFFSHETLGYLLGNNGFQVLDHYYPTRHMSIRHLVKRWLPRLLPSAMVENVAKSMKLWERTVGLNIGDIVTVMACKQ